MLAVAICLSSARAMDSRSSSLPTAVALRTASKTATKSIHAARRPEHDVAIPCTATMRRDKSFETKFAIFGCSASLVALALLAFSCGIARQNGWNEWDLPWEDLAINNGDQEFSMDENGAIHSYAFSTGNHDKVGNSDRKVRRKQRFLSDGGNSENESSSSSFGCGDIFLFVKERQPINARSASEQNMLQNLRRRHLQRHLQFKENGLDDPIYLSKQSNSQSYNQRLCRYAQTCDGEWPSRIFLPLILCHGVDMAASANEHPNDNETNDPSQSDRPTTQNSRTFQYYLTSILLYLLLPPLLLLYLLLLFRLLASTADRFFSPALETFSFELGLPPRFAGATLLALGNGSPDLGSTVNAILLWDEVAAKEAVSSGGGGVGGRTQGWTMSLGSLTGGGMFVGTIVCGLIVQTCGGITCRVAFLRDVSMYALSVFVVRRVFESGRVTLRDVSLFLGMYAGYVTVIFCADMYHKKVTLHRIHEEGKKRRQSINIERVKRLSTVHELCSAAISSSEKFEANAGMVNEVSPLMLYHPPYGKEIESTKDGGMTTEDVDSRSSDVLPPEKKFPRPRLSITDRFAMMMSNYDPRSVKFDFSSRSTSTVSGDPELDAISSFIHNIHIPPTSSTRAEVLPLETGQKQSIFSSSFGDVESTPAPESDDISRRWSIYLMAEAYEELVFQSSRVWFYNFHNETSYLEKMGSFLELPFTVLRKVSLIRSTFLHVALLSCNVLHLCTTTQFFPTKSKATIPVPCEDHYCRPLIALSMALSPFWVLWYLEVCYLTIPASIFFVSALLIAISVLRYAGDEKMPLVAAVSSLFVFSTTFTFLMLPNP